MNDFEAWVADGAVVPAAPPPTGADALEDELLRVAGCCRALASHGGWRGGASAWNDGEGVVVELRRPSTPTLSEALRFACVATPAPTVSPPSSPKARALAEQQAEATARQAAAKVRGVALLSPLAQLNHF